MSVNKKRKAENELPRGRRKLPAVRCADCDEYDTFEECGMCGVEYCSDCGNLEDNWCTEPGCDRKACHECMCNNNYEYTCREHLPGDCKEICSNKNCSRDVVVCSLDKKCVYNNVFCAVCKNPYCSRCFRDPIVAMCRGCEARCPHSLERRTEECLKCRASVCRECIQIVYFKGIEFQRCKTCPPTPGENGKIT